MATNIEYFEQDKARDPSGDRTKWILQKLAFRRHTGAELKKLSEKNGLGYAPATYVKDMTGLVNRGFVYNDAGKYGLDRRGADYMVAMGINV